jgi:hypothetical protein
MAGRIGVARVAGVTLPAAVETGVQIKAATNHAVKVLEIGVSFHGTSATNEPVLVDALRQTTAGTASALTLVKQDDSQGDTFDTTAQHTFTAEPTAGDILRSWAIHPQRNIVYPVDPLAPILVGAGDYFGVRATAPDAVNADFYIVFEE